MSNQAELIIESAKLAKTKTNNTLHFFLSLFSAGLWIPIWMLIALSNYMERARLEKNIKEFAKPT